VQAVMLRPVHFVWTSAARTRSLLHVLQELSMPNVPVRPQMHLKVLSSVTKPALLAPQVVMLVLPVLLLSLLARPVLLLRCLPNVRVCPVQAVMPRSVHFVWMFPAPKRSLQHVPRMQFSLPNVPVGPQMTVLVLSPVTSTARFALKVVMLLLPVLLLTQPLRVRPVVLL
jgi:hypothetical protein